MDPERWREIEALFVEAAALPEDERDGFLARRCADEGVRREVAALLARDRATDASIVEAIARATDRIDEEPPARPLPRRVGPYELGPELGQGGMGVVFRATRDDDVHRGQVAIKFIRAGVDRAELERRFRIERRILAGLDHPNIARLIDGGATGDGQPYFVMEHVLGQPIDAYCDERQLGTAARLELFCTVCAAVEHAHRNLVVHRDIKPANILVTRDGVPKLVDFGIAKLLEAELPAAAAQTATILRAFTPEYASPEQIRGEPVTTASDVYALGVVLYQLLCGRGPYRLRTPRAVELEEAICEQDAERPSLAVTRPRTGATAVAEPTSDSIGASRRTDPARLKRQLRGDLDDIVLMALHKDPRRRYASVDRLAEDIRRHLRGLPVAARRPTLWYRGGRLLRRHRWAFGGVATAVVALAALGTLHVQRLERERAIAEREREAAQHVSDFLVDLFRVANPGSRSPDTITAKEILDAGAGRVAKGLDTEPLARARLEDAIGHVYANLGDYDAAERQLDRALEERRRLLPAHSPDLAQTLRNLGFVYRERGQYARALPLLEEAVAILARDEAANRLLLADTLREVGNLHLRDGQYEAMREALERALALREAAQGPDHPEVAAILTDLAAWRWRTGDLGGARKQFERVLAIRETSYGASDARIAANLHNLGLVTWSLGDYRAALRYYERALAINEAVLGPDNPQVAPMLYGLGTTLRDLDDLEGSRRQFDRLLKLQQRSPGPESNHYAFSLGGYGFTLLELGQLDAAREVFERSIAILEKTLGPEHLDVGAPLVGLARVEIERGQLDAAEAHLERALSLRVKALGPEHPIVGRTHTPRGKLLVARGDFAGAAERCELAVAILERSAGAEHPYVAEALFGLGEARERAGHADAAEELYRRAFAIREKALGPAHRLTSQVRARFAAVLRTMGRVAEAEALDRR